MKERPVPTVLAMITHKDRILLIKRNKYPYIGYWALIAGKLEMDETVEEAAIREAKEETGLACRSMGIKAVIHERLKEGEKTNFSGILFFVHLGSESETFSESDEGDLRWFSRSELDDARMILSDRWMIKDLSKDSAHIHQIIIEEKDGELVSMKKV